MNSCYTVQLRYKLIEECAENVEIKLAKITSTEKENMHKWSS